MTSAAAAAMRGQPVVAMLAVLCGWVLLRLVFWQSPVLFEQARSDWTFASTTEAFFAQSEAVGANATPPHTRIERDFTPLVRIELGGRNEGLLPAEAGKADIGQSDAASQSAALRRMSRDPGSLSESPAEEKRRRGVASAVTMADPVFTPAAGAPSRWLGSSWFFWRDNSPRERQAATTPNYGRSQAGAVLAYRLAPESRFRPQVYTRATAALEGPREGDLAVGLSARPVPDVPVRLAAEGRLSLRDGTSELRPAAYAVTELPPFALPAQLVGEVYAQAGWVGGDFATGFVDAQMRVTRPLAQSRNFALSAGGGAWAGAQKGTRRLDVGPSVSASFRLSDDVYGRLSADYRVRVAGNAAPASGPALTLSAGF